MEVKQHIDFILDAKKCIDILVKAASQGKNAVKIQLAITDEGKFKVLAMPTKVTLQGPVNNELENEDAHEACPVPPGCNNDTKCKENFDELVTVLDHFEANQPGEGFIDRSITFNW